MKFPDYTMYIIYIKYCNVVQPFIMCIYLDSFPTPRSYRWDTSIHRTLLHPGSTNIGQLRHTTHLHVWVGYQVNVSHHCFMKPRKLFHFDPFERHLFSRQTNRRHNLATSTWTARWGNLSNPRRQIFQIFADKSSNFSHQPPWTSHFSVKLTETPKWKHPIAFLFIVLVSSLSKSVLIRIISPDSRFLRQSRPLALSLISWWVGSIQHWTSKLSQESFAVLCSF